MAARRPHRRIDREVADRERDAGGCLITIVIGIAGSLLAGWAGSHLFHWYRDGSNPGWIASIVGAVALIALVRVVTSRR